MKMRTVKETLEKRVFKTVVLAGLLEESILSSTKSSLGNIECVWEQKPLV